MRIPNLIRATSLFLLIPALAATAAAQEVRLGGLEGNGAVFVGSPATLIDWSQPAVSSGTVNTATVAWTNVTAPCDGIFSVRFYAIPSNALASVMTAERGPFRAVAGMNTVTLDPPVAVTPETYIGVRRFEGPDSCGQPFGTFTREPGRVLFSSTDFKGGSLTGLSPASNFRLQAQASNVPSVLVATIPVVGSVAGSFNSFFRTSLTLSNPRDTDIHGKLVLRVSGRTGSDSDPSFDYTVPANGTVNYDDIIATMGQSGLGSLDIFTTASVTPIATARVFNDTGAAGTSGFGEDAVPANNDYSSVADIFVPTDLTNFRLNIGVRTFKGGTIYVAVYNAAGQVQQNLTKTYAADYFEQVPATTFLGNPPPAGGKIVLSVYQQPFIAYGAVTDNRTNDPSMRVGSD